MKKYYFLAFGVFILSYFLVPAIFFQQDEILGFGLFIKEGKSVILSGLGRADIRHFVPITMSLSYSIFKIFGIKYQVYNLLALLFHLINGYLVYLVAKHIFKKKEQALISVLLFFSSNVAAQLLMWPVINLNTLSLAFALLAWLAVLTKKLFWTPILFLLAVFSVEYSAGLAFFIPLTIFFTIGKNLKEKIIKTIPFGLTVLVYSAFRLWPIISAGGAGLGVMGGNNHSFLTVIFNLVSRYFGQLFFGQGVLLSLSKIIQKTGGLASFGTAYAETGIFPVLSTIAGLIVIVIAVLFYRGLKKDKEYSRNFLLCLAFIFFSSLPFLLVPGGSGLSTVIASRYMYFGLAGASFVSVYVYRALVEQTKKTRLIANIVLVAVTVLGTSANYSSARALYEQGTVRLKILNTIKDAYPILPKKAIFFTESDISYYGLPPEEKILPFQSGLGQTLLLFYYEEAGLPKEFYPGDYLWEITSQGYKEVDERGLGYFRDRLLLKKTIEDYNIPSSSVIAFSWYSQTGELRDITDEIRKQLR